MAKTAGIIVFGLFSLIFSFAIASANTLVGGKIYNSDFSQVIEGADVSVQCGSETLNTASMSDGAYAVVFDSDSCYLSSTVSVSASKEKLSNQGSSNVYESEGEKGEFVAVINLNLKAVQTTGTSAVKKHSGGTWFQCGNTVCDSGETFKTCPADCPQTQENTTTPLTTSTETSDSNPENSNQETQNSATNEQTSNSGITGEVVENDGSVKKVNLPALLAGLILVLIILIAIAASIGDMEDKKNKKLGAAVAETSMQ